MPGLYNTGEQIKRFMHSRQALLSAKLHPQPQIVNNVSSTRPWEASRKLGRTAISCSCALLPGLYLICSYYDPGQALLTALDTGFLEVMA